MLDCRKGAFDSVPSGCFDRRKKQHNYGGLVKGTTALPDTAVENVLLQRALAAVAREGMFRAVRRCRLCTHACTSGYHVRQCALGVLHAAGKPRGTEPYSDSGDQEIQRSEQIGAALAQRGDTVTQLVCRDACHQRGIHDEVPGTDAQYRIEAGGGRTEAGRGHQRRDQRLRDQRLQEPCGGSGLAAWPRLPCRTGRLRARRSPP